MTSIIYSVYSASWEIDKNSMDHNETKHPNYNFTVMRPVNH